MSTTQTQVSSRSIVPNGEWRLDPERSRLEWKVEGEKNHSGSFAEFEGTVSPTRVAGVIGPVSQPVELHARADETPRIRATGQVSIGDVSATVLVEPELLAA